MSNIETIIDDYMLTYSYYTVYHRAIPNLLDGLKVSQRMITEVLKNINSFEKCNTVAGKVMLLHAHGDSYPTIVNMIQRDNNNMPLVLGKGSFSSRTTRDGVPASSRYTECKISPFGKTIVGNKEEIDLIPSYDNKTTIPVSFSPDFPLILLNGQQGIATGFSINIPQYNLKDICEATIKVLQGKPYAHIYPDFSTGGYIDKTIPMDNSSMKYTLRGKCKIEGNSVLITEIPYYTTREQIIEKIEELTLDGTMKEVKDIDDLTDKDGLLIDIQLKRNTDKDSFINKLYNLTPLQCSFTTNIGYIHNNKLVYSNVEDLLKNWVETKTINIVKGAKKRLTTLNEKLEIADAFRKTVSSLDWLGQRIMQTEEDEIEKMLIQLFNITPIGAKYLSELGIKYFRESYFYKKINEVTQLEKERKKVLEIIENGGKEELIKRLQKIIKDWGQPRKTLIKDLSLNKIEKNKTIDEFSGEVHLTKQGYIYKTKAKSITLCPGDEIINSYNTKENGEILMFNKQGDCYKFYLEDIPTVSAKEIGYYAGVDDVIGANYIENKDMYILKIFDDGHIVKEDINSYRTSTKRKKLAKSLYTGGELLNVITLEDDIIITLETTRTEKTIETSTLIAKKSRDSKGVKVCKKIKNIKKF